MKRIVGFLTANFDTLLGVSISLAFGLCIGFIAYGVFLFSESLGWITVGLFGIVVLVALTMYQRSRRGEEERS